jgi:hypothetical protein
MRARQQRAGAELIMITQQYIENSLYNGELWCAMRNGRWWRARRNGQTKTWKTRAGEFRIPVKAGLRSCGEITHTSRVALITDADWRSADFVISARDPSEVRS